MIILSKCAKINQKISKRSRRNENKEITVLDQAIHINKDDYFSLTDIARYKNPDAPADVVKNWLRRKGHDRVYRIVGATEQSGF